MSPRDIQIKNYEGWFQRAVRRILVRAGCGEVHLADRITMGKLPASRIDVLFIKGPAGEISLSDQGDETQDDIAGRLLITIATKREQTQAQLPEGVQGLHEDWAARVRAALAFKENPFGGLLPFYTVTQIGEGQDDRDLDLNFWQDFTRLSFELRYSINGGAWNLTDAQVAAFSDALAAG